MSGALSKRQQARNEKILHELVQSVPGNNFCADCNGRNPAWASWSLGIFLCMRCAAIHRKLGTHVSKVKSLSMDSWSNEQVENMKKVGNVVSNKNYNPSNKLPPVPIDVDEADAAMERFIRQKYTSDKLVAERRRTTGSTESDETPPPLPPKTPSRFGFRAATSIFPIGSKAKKAAASRDRPDSPRDAPSPHRNKPSQVFGAVVSWDNEDTDKKLARLRDMGFTDDRKNVEVLKGVGGSLERAIESLVRLGEGGGRTPTSLASPRESSLSLTRSLTPATSTSGREGARAGPIAPSNNPFDMLDMPPAQPLSSQSTGTLQNRNPYLTTNPFGLVSQQSHTGLNQAFQSMSLSPSQPLFPHHTGGMAAAPQQQNAQVLYQQQPVAPQMPSAAQNYSSVAFNSHQTYPQPGQPAQGGYNPFFTNGHSPPQPLSVNTAGAPGTLSNNPFTRSPTRIHSPPLTQIPEQSQQNFYTASPSQATNPFFSQAAPQASPYASQDPFGQAPRAPQQPFGQVQQAPQQPFGQPFGQPYQQQPAGLPQRVDNASILALFNQAPARAGSNPFLAQGQQAPTQPPSGPAPNGQQLFHSQTFPLSAGQQQQQQQQQQPQQQQVPRASSGPGPGSMNPFLSGGAQSGVAQPSLLDVTPSKHNVSRDSMMARGMDWSNGRHSPDAFASLSARAMR